MVNLPTKLVAMVYTNVNKSIRFIHYVQCFISFVRSLWRTCTMVQQGSWPCRKVLSVPSVKDEEERRCVRCITGNDDSKDDYIVYCAY